MFRHTRWAAPLIASLFLTACGGGGGGVNSTGTPAGSGSSPTPSPSATPTPSPSATPTPSPAIEVPLPPSTPTPTAVNSSLMGTKVSETFINTAAGTSARFGSNGVSNGQAQLETLTVSYNASNQSYTLSKGGQTQAFTSANAVNSGNTDFAAYQKTTGSVQEALTLTTPGTSGALTYQYVGGGAWERADVSSGTLDFSYTPFTYGAATADSAVQRTGTGLFSVSLVGARIMDQPYAVAGDGKMQVDFQKGLLTANGNFTTMNVQTGYVESLGIYFASATLSSTTNNFAGAFAMDDGSRYTGAWVGKFYGPSNQEVGATWYISNNNGEYAAGYLIGRQDSSVTPYNMSLTPIQYSERFDARTSNLTFTDMGNGIGNNTVVSRAIATLSYNAGAASYRYVDDNNSIDTTFTSANRSAGLSNSAADVYQMTDGSGINYKLTLSKPGSGNPQIALSYMSFGHWEQAQSVSQDARDRWFAYGVRTNPFQIPTGTGTFNGIVAGKAVAWTGGETFNLTGTSSFDVNFSAATFTGSLNPVGTSLVNGASRNFGSFSFSGGAMDKDGGLSANVMSGGNFAGYFEGALYGPNATELGGVFGLQSGGYTINGAAAAKR